MKIRTLTVSVLTLAGLVSLGGVSYANRSAAPADGAPYPADVYHHFSYGGVGMVFHTWTEGTDNWDLTCHIDSSGNKSAHITAKGNGNSGVSCWGVALGPDGNGIIGNSQGIPAGCAGNPAPLDTPNVNVPTNGSFIVTCQLPAAQTNCTPRIAFHSFTSPIR